MGRCYIFVDTCDVCKIREEFPPIILFYTLKSLIIYVSRTIGISGFFFKKKESGIPTPTSNYYYQTH